MIWKDIPGYEGLYQVSNRGDVKSLDRITTGNRRRRIKGKLLSKTFTSTGYYKVELCKDGKRKSLKVHRLVAIAFIKNPDCKPYINHIDCNPLNNCVENLEWCTPKENTAHSITSGNFKFIKPVKSVVDEDLIVSAINEHIPHDRKHSYGAIARRNGVNVKTLYSAIRSYLGGMNGYKTGR